MLKLFINTASSLTSFFCLQNEVLLCFQEWEAKNDEASNLLPRINNCFQDSNLKFKDIKEIIAVKGPGSFTGLRIGVTVANTLKSTLQTKLKEIDLFTFYENRNPGVKGTIIIKAGKNEVYLKQTNSDLDSVEIHPFNEEVISKLDTQSWGDLTNEQEVTLQKWLKSNNNKKWIPNANLLSTPDAIKNIDLQEVPLIKPFYIKKPAITLSNKN